MPEDKSFKVCTTFTCFNNAICRNHHKNVADFSSGNNSIGSIESRTSTITVAALNYLDSVLGRNGEHEWKIADCGDS
jgi:hypothetical protein